MSELYKYLGHRVLTNFVLDKCPLLIIRFTKQDQDRNPITFGRFCKEVQ